MVREAGTRAHQVGQAPGIVPTTTGLGAYVIATGFAAGAAHMYAANKFADTPTLQTKNLALAVALGVLIAFVPLLILVKMEK